MKLGLRRVKPYRTNKTVQVQLLAKQGFVRYVRFGTVFRECRRCTLFTLLNYSASWVTIKEKGGDEDGKILY